MRFLAFDLGASNGRALAALFDGDRLTIEDVHGFPNEPVFVNESMHWDVLRLFSEMKTGLAAAARKFGTDFAGIGVDTWGVDYGLLDRVGNLIGNPYHYRDSRTEGMVEEIDRIVGRYHVYEITGTQLVGLCTLSQLYSMVHSKTPALEIADMFLTMPSLLNYFLSGEKYQEYSNINPGSLWDFRNDSPAEDILGKLGIASSLLGTVVQPGTVVGHLSKRIQEETGLAAIPIIAPATHDTASAVVSVPAEGDNWAFVSSGTWSILGMESGSPVATRESYDLGITNESTAEGKFMTISNLTGLWILQQCKKIWDTGGEAIGYGELAVLAEQAPAFSAFVDVDDPSFMNPVNMPHAISAYCRSTSQAAPEDKGTFARVVLESLAMRHRSALRGLEKLTGRKFDVLHMVGGGARNELLCQFTADAIGIPVAAGPYEATALGNIIMQMVGAGVIGSVAEGRAVIRRSVPVKMYDPVDPDNWDEAYCRYSECTARGL